MGRYRSRSSSRSSGSDNNHSGSKRSKRRKKDRRRGGRSRSSSQSDSSRYSSSKYKKSKKKHSHRSSLSPDKRGGCNERSRRSRSRSRSKSYERYESHSRRHSRSHSYERKRSRRSRTPDSKRRRSRSQSYSRDHRSCSGSRERGSKGQETSRSWSIDRASSSRENSNLSVSQSVTSLKTLSVDEQKESHKQMSLAEQAEERMRQALKAAAAADEKLRLEALLDDRRMASPDIRHSQRFASSVADIESDSFVPASFKSSRDSKIKDESSEICSVYDNAIFGSLSVSGFTLKPDPDNRPLDLDTDSIVHPSLFCDPEEKMEHWIERLSQLRRRKLEGEIMQ